MSFDHLPDAPPLTLPGGPEYAEYTLRRSREAASRLDHELDIPYGPDPFQKLDIYAPPESPRDDLPVLMFIHGGAWAKGHKEWMGFMAPAIVSLPALFVSVNHRLAPGSRFPAQLDDCAAALAWLIGNISRYGGSAKNIFAGGHSSGGHLAALLTLRAQGSGLNGVPAGVIRGCAVLSAPLDLSLARAEGRRAEMIRQFLADDGDDRDASPMHHVTGNRVPFLVARGTRDLPEVMEHAREFIDALEREGAETSSLVLDGLDHFQTSLACEDPDGECARAIRALMWN